MRKRIVGVRGVNVFHIQDVTGAQIKVHNRCKDLIDIHITARDSRIMESALLKDLADAVKGDIDAG